MLDAQRAEAKHYIIAAQIANRPLLSHYCA
jgi:hypothetical protein